MKISRRRFITIAAAASLSSVSAFASQAEGARWTGVALGAKADLRLFGLAPDDAGRLLLEARAEIERLEREFSLYRTDSALAQLNGTGTLDTPSPDMLELLSLADSIHAASAGAFDPTVQPLWQAYANNRGVPSAETLDALAAVTGWKRVEYSSERVVLPQGGGLTLNGIAQGFVTDAVAAFLRRAGLKHAFVEVGEITAIGTAPAGGPWSVRLEDRPAAETLPLVDSSIATSAAQGTVFGDGGASHIIDPRKGRATLSPWRQVSVIHRSAAMADGLSTACVMLSAGEIRRMMDMISGAAFVGLGAGGETVRI